jgi:hypothetical protein
MSHCNRRSKSETSWSKIVKRTLFHRLVFSVDPADADIFGIRSTLAAHAVPADINGRSPLA